MEPTFRKSMAWLHTWCGVVTGSVLFVIFWMGSLSVFDQEIDRWMMPGTRLTVTDAPIKLDGAISETAQRLGKGSPNWLVRLPTKRTPAVELRWRGKDEASERRYLDPATGQLLAHTDTLAGTGFIFPFHFRLHLKWMDLGHWLAGLAGMAMMVMVVSGVVIHRKIFADFFLFRPQKHMQRASLDLHNLTGVLAMPFHFVIALSGLVIMFAMYFPSSYRVAYPQAEEARQNFNAEAYGQFKRPKAQQPGSLASIDAMVAAAEAHWQGSKASMVWVWHPGDANSYVEVRRGYEDRVTMTLEQAYFDAGTGQLIQRFEAAPVVTVQRFISGLHFIQFDHWILRWLYFVAGLSGCVMILTGFLFWLESRRASHARNGLAGVRLVEALTVFSVPGIMAATLVFFIVNRLLPLDASLGGFGRAALEMWGFYLAWLVTLVHATLRGHAAWREQSWAVAVLATIAVALNWATTGHHLAYTLSHDLWAVAGMDLALLATAGLAAGAARHLVVKAARTPAAQVAAPNAIGVCNSTRRT